MAAVPLFHWPTLRLIRVPSRYSHLLYNMFGLNEQTIYIIYKIFIFILTESVSSHVYLHVCYIGLISISNIYEERKLLPQQLLNINLVMYVNM